MTQSKNIIPTSFITLPRPEELQITKRYLQAHIDELQKELEHVRSIGTSQAAEWLKDLPDRGKERMRDSSRWESFEIKGGFTYIFQQTEQQTELQVTRRESVSNGGSSDPNTMGNYATYSAYDGYPGYPGYPQTICKLLSSQDFIFIFIFRLFPVSLNFLFPLLWY